MELCHSERQKTCRIVWIAGREQDIIIVTLFQPMIYWCTILLIMRLPQEKVKLILLKGIMQSYVII